MVAFLQPLLSSSLGATTSFKASLRIFLRRLSWIVRPRRSSASDGSLWSMGVVLRHKRAMSGLCWWFSLWEEQLQLISLGFQYNHCYVDSGGSLSHAGNPVQFSCKILECLATVVGPIIASYHLGNALLTENLSQHCDYCVAVSLSPWYLPNKRILWVIISNH